ncbi:hypothetical protein DMH04_52910 [Kibdelosporangium aridum]|uniref:DUF1877 domain-containing protein n=1 Tax=Kibdelosporangium aridum TaxID=2030 RepID=A0A428Y3J6_KIBAR|nr:hypothetical protein [Kibdelosporangium aridum]RSM62147.1 hypothetical protein DMH04_52910 [Kibdelosporangium aridum]
MGLLTDYFSAASDELAATALHAPGGPLHAEPPFKTVEAKGIEPSVTLARLAMALTGEDYDVVTADPGWDRAVADDEEMYVCGVADKLRDALAQADDARLPQVAAQWAEAEEFLGHADPEFLTELVKELVDLARHATEQGERLYVWVCL